MPELALQLAPLTQKDPIVSTFDSRVFGEQHKVIISSYEHHAATYIEFDPLRDLEHRFIQKVLAHQTPKACLVGQYGQGKTTAAIGIWQKCQQAGILTTPPASYSTLADLALGVYTWVFQTLQVVSPTPIEALKNLEQLHQTYLQASTEDLARLVSRRSGRDFIEVLSVLNDSSLIGSLRLDPSTTNIVLFLDALSQLVISIGYSGLVIIIDEFQQLLGVAGPETLTGLRSLIWGLRTRQIALGLLITMDTASERTLGERAGDILHRIKDDDLYLNFQQIYHPDFPRLLWERYASQLNFNGLTYRMVDKPTLEALGQICERSDLSNGPRTVVNVFRRIAARYTEYQLTYNPLQLIEDFVSGAIIFDGDTSIIAGLVSEYINYPYFKRSENHQAVLKLLAAFPDGCSSEIAERYGLADTFSEVTSELRGEIVTRLPNGYALIDLQKAGKPLDKLGIILRKYWLQISDAQLDVGETTRRFAQYVLPLLLPAQGQLEVWTAVEPIALSATDNYLQTFNGRLHARHPLRNIATIIGWQTDDFPLQNTNNCDLNLYFQLHGDSSRRSEAKRVGSGILQFNLNVTTPPESGLPAELRLVEHNLSPQPATPAVLLSVIEFIEREAGQFDLSQSEQLKINRTVENIRRWIVTSLFEARLLATLDPEAATPGYRGFRDLLYRECERLFPNYHTLITSVIWRENLILYMRVLREQPLAVRRGLQPLTGPKSQLAALFNQRTHAGFDSKLRVQYPDLLEIGWSGDTGSLIFRPHPLETIIFSRISETGLSLLEVRQLGQSLGYSPVEIDSVIELLTARGQAQQEGQHLYKIATLSLAEIKYLTSQLYMELAEFEKFLPASLITPILRTAQKLNSTASEATQELDHIQLVGLTEQIGNLRQQVKQKLLIQLQNQQTRLAKLSRQLESVVPGFGILTGFRSHLEGARKHLEVQQLRWQKQVEAIHQDTQIIRQSISSSVDSNIAQYLATLKPSLPQREAKLVELEEQVANYTYTVGLLGQWVNWGGAFDRLYQQSQQLSKWLSESDPINQQLILDLATLNQGVQSLLSKQGLEELSQIEHFQDRLRVLQMDFDRNLTAREKAFDQEKISLTERLTLILGNTPRLRSKYQASKHSESYSDVYEEGQTFLLSNRAIWEKRVNQLVTSLAKWPKNSEINGRTKQSVKNLLVKTHKLLISLLEADLTQAETRSNWQQNLNKLAELVAIFTQIESNLAAQFILEPAQLNLVDDPKPLFELVNIADVLIRLKSDEPLAQLLQRYLAGEISITVAPKIEEKTND